MLLHEGALALRACLRVGRSLTFLVAHACRLALSAPAFAARRRLALTAPTLNARRGKGAGTASAASVGAGTGAGPGLRRLECWRCLRCFDPRRQRRQRTAPSPAVEQAQPGAVGTGAVGVAGSVGEAKAVTAAEVAPMPAVARTLRALAVEEVPLVQPDLFRANCRCKEFNFAFNVTRTCFIELEKGNFNCLPGSYFTCCMQQSFRVLNSSRSTVHGSFRAL